MKILVLSDSHNYLFNLEEILQKECSAEIIIHCGDGADDIYPMYEFTEHKALYLCKGNCDITALGLNEEQLLNIGGHTIFACHGHKYNVKYGMDTLWIAGRAKEADICLFGHTHTPYYEEDRGVHLFNPGAVAEGNYGILELTDEKLLFTHKKI